MAYRNLQHFLKRLEEEGELRRISIPVSPVLEMTEIADRVSKAHGPALLFTRPEGSAYPVVMNAFGSERRMCLALGVDSLEEIAADLGAYLDLGQYLSPGRLLRGIPRYARLLYALSWHSRLPAPCQQVVEREPDLSALPVLHCWPQDAGRFLTLPLVFTRDPHSHRQNVGMYRMQVLDKTTTAMHWHKHKDGSAFYQEYARQGTRMPVSVALGCDPALTYAATAPLPPEIDEMMLAGWLRRANVRMTRCKTNDIYVPTEAEFVLEGYVDPAEDPVLEGPFGDHTGYYSLADFYPRFHVTCLTRRRRPVYPATVVGKPPMEDCYLAKATERIFLPFLKLQVPELLDLELPLEGVFHNCAIVSVKNRYPGSARKVMSALWGMGQMMYTKLIVAVGETVDIHSPAAVWREISRRVGREDLVLSPGPLDALDHSSSRALYGCRLGVDATGTVRASSPDSEDGYRILTIRKARPFDGRRALEAFLPAHRERFVLCVDDSVDPSDLPTVLWKLFNNIDAGRDLVYHGEKIGVDATRKLREEGLDRDWPDDIVMTEEIKARVDGRWDSYGL